MDNLSKEGGGKMRRLLSAAMAVILAVTLAIPQGLALAETVPVSEYPNQAIDGENILPPTTETDAGSIPTEVESSADQGAQPTSRRWKKSPVRKIPPPILVPKRSKLVTMLASPSIRSPWQARRRLSWGRWRATSRPSRARRAWCA